MNLDYKILFLVVCWIFILFRIRSFSRVFRYRFLAIFVWVALCNLGVGYLTIRVFGLNSPEHVYVYTLLEITFRVSGSAFLIWLASVPRSLSRVDALVIGGITVAAAALELAVSPDSFFLWRLMRAALFAQCGIAALACWRCFAADSFRVGWNMGVPLVALFLRSAVETINASAYLGQIWEFSGFAGLMDFLSVIMWGVIAVAQFELDPPQRRH